VLLVVSFITFTLMHLVPGGPWSREKALAPAVVAALNARYGLDKPFFVQYANFLLGILHGNLGISYTYQDRSVTQILMQGFPKTAILGTTAFVFAMIVGISLGMAAALRQNTWIDYVCVMFSTIFASVPGFVLGILLMIVFQWYCTGSPPAAGVRRLKLSCLLLRWQPYPPLSSPGLPVPVHWRPCVRTMCAPHVLKVYWNEWF